MIRNVAVYCASADGADPAYRRAAEHLGRELAQRNIGIIYGGANVGLMQAVAESSLVLGGRVIGVIPKVLVDLEVAHRGVSELHVTSTMHTRKEMMMDLADAFLVLPGGYGTLEELFEVVTWRALRIHEKPVVLVNINGFYDKMLAFLDHCVDSGVLKQRNRNLLVVVATVDEVFAALEV